MKRFKFTLLALILIIIAVIFNSKDKGNAIKVGDSVPSFRLKDQNNQWFDISEHVGKRPMVIYFYPKDDTPGCTKEACTFRDEFSTFRDLDAEIIGISSDDVESHKAFAEKYQLPFTLLADTNKTVRKQFGVPPVLGLIPGRVTYVIDKNGTVIHVFDKMRGAEQHIQEAIYALNKS